MLLEVGSQVSLLSVSQVGSPTWSNSIAHVGNRRASRWQFLGCLWSSLHISRIGVKWSGVVKFKVGQIELGRDSMARSHVAGHTQPPHFAWSRARALSKARTTSSSECCVEVSLVQLSCGGARVRTVLLLLRRFLFRQIDEALSCAQALDSPLIVVGRRGRRPRLEIL